MRFLLLICLAPLFAITGCVKDPVLKTLPDCVQDLAKDIKRKPVGNPPLKIYSYTFEGETVYYIPSRCCDIPSQLYNEDCEFICAPDGGFTGGGDGQCPSFWSEATDEKLLWEDPRE